MSVTRSPFALHYWVRINLSVTCAIYCTSL